VPSVLFDGDHMDGEMIDGPVSDQDRRPHGDDSGEKSDPH